jgi:hypothetical protein
VEREWWLMALLGFVVLVGLLLLALFTVGLLDPVSEPEPVAIPVDPASEVSLDPVRAWVGVGAAILFFGAALWVIRRTDWSLDEP